MDIKQLRDEIDVIDKQLVKLLEQRMKVVTNVALYKKENNLPVFDETREVEVLAKNVALVQEEELKNSIENILKSIMDISKDFQKTKI